ncbi:hypothetical protein G210_3540 [Candida maltosa Xu316]|uniref:Uncharacterized protein n=1 Tax=Candida maltosa (strain Xu316) TaxID=1245528 RepID=M3J2W6_CANMX|nr:hypothetical protein G210_3540 [Candida maltosa Xu316]
MTSLANGLLKLPSDVINYIFSFIPNSFLQKLIDIPVIRGYVLTSLYASIKLDNIPSLLAQRIDPDVVTPYLEYKDVVSLIKNDNLTSFQSIEVSDPKLILKLHEDYPEVLNDNNINISYFRTDFSKYEDVDTFKELKELPYVFDSVRNFYQYDEEKYGSNKKFYNQVRKLRITDKNFPSDIFSGDYEFKNLIELSILELNADQLQHLPRGLKSLECEIKNEEGLIDGFAKLPVGLVKLNIKVVGDEPLSSVDLSYLENLEEIVYSGIEDVQFPKHLKVVETANKLNLGQLNRQSPGLRKLKYEKAATENSTFKLPETLRELVISTAVLPTITTTNGNSTSAPKKQKIHESIKLPSYLRKLTINGNGESIGKVVQVFKSGDDLPYLQESNLNNLGKDIILGDLPASITKLTIKGETSFSYEGLSKLPRLNDLSIINPGGKEFSIDLPPQIERFKLQEGNFESIDIKSETLKKLVFWLCDLRVLGNDTLKIPESVTDCHIAIGVDFAESYDFPPNLESLHLWGDHIESNFELPTTLKKLSYFHQTMTPDGDFDLEFPDSLEEIVFEYGGAGFDIENLKWDNCTKLKKATIALIDTEDGELLLDQLPESLTHLTIYSSFEIGISDTFERFENLEEVLLEGEFKAEGSIGALKFGPNIRYVSIPEDFFENAEEGDDDEEDEEEENDNEEGGEDDDGEDDDGEKEKATDPFSKLRNKLKKKRNFQELIYSNTKCDNISSM